MFRNPRANEDARLRALVELDVLDTEPEEELDALVRAAAVVCGVPISLVSLIDKDRQWFKANVGLTEVQETPREVAFCHHAILGPDILEIPDATEDPRFVNNPLVTGDPGIRFYAGAPLQLAGGERVGTLCVIDRVPRRLDDHQREILGLLRQAAVRCLEGKRALSRERANRIVAERAAAVLSNSFDAIVVQDLEGRITNWNRAAEELFGYSMNEMLGHTMARLRPADQPGIEFDPRRAFEEDPAGLSRETSLISRQGEVLPISVSLAPIRGEDGALVGATQILRDLRPEKQMARDLAHRDVRFRVFCEGLPVGVFVTDPSGACTYTNPRWQDIYGMGLEQSLGDGWNLALHPEDRDRVLEEWQQRAPTGSEFDLRFRVLTADAGTRHLHTRAMPLLDPDGKITGHVSTVEDVSELRRASRTLEDQRRRLENIIEGTGAGTWEWNVQTGETRVNGRWTEILGYDIDEIAPTTFDDWEARIHPEDLAHTRTRLVQHLRGAAESFECETRLRHRDGHWVWVLDSGRLLSRTSDGEPEWMFGTHVEITERKQQEEALRRSESLLNRMGEIARIGGWEYDIRTGALAWSQQTRRIHGVSDSYEPTIEEAIQFFPPEARATVETAVQHALETGESWDLEVLLEPATGDTLWVRGVGHVEHVDGVPARLVGTLQDVDAQVRQRLALQEANDRLALATDSGGIGVWSFDPVSKELIWDRWMYRIYGLDFPGPEEATIGIGTYDLWARHLHPEDRSTAENSVVRALRGTEGFDTEFRIIQSNGLVRHIRATARIQRDESGSPVRMVGVNWDVTATRNLASQLADEHELLRVTMQSIGDAVISTNAQGRITWMNPVAERMTGWSVDAALHLPLEQVFKIYNEHTRKPAESPVARCLAQDSPAGLAQDTLLVSRSGQEFGIEDSAAPIRDARGEAVGVVIVFHDVSEQRRLSGEMTYRATHDALTGLYNRTEFDTQLKSVLQKARTEGSSHVLLYIDLDRFKLVNDACGHSAGDQLLQQITKILQVAIRTDDVLARLGGDEFGVILEDCTTDHALRVADSICGMMDEFRFLHDQRRFRVGASIGLVPVDARWGTTAAVLNAADASCYAAKESGRNRVHTWRDNDHTLMLRNGEMRWSRRIEQALNEDEFVLHAQRIIALKQPSTGLHAEVLLRMLDPDKGLINPGAFLPAAERFHFTSRIDGWVLGKVIRLIEEHERLSEIETLSVNVSGQSVGDRAFHRMALDTLVSAGPEVCRRICIEITETAAIMNLADAQVFLQRMRELGVKIALDDFGTGASSFAYLKSLPVDQLKIDGQFVRDVIDDPLDDVTIRCFVEVAEVVGMGTVAEYVDRPEVLERLKQIDVDFAQGFLLHKPEPLERLLAHPGLLPN